MRLSQAAAAGTGPRGMALLEDLRRGGTLARPGGGIGGGRGGVRNTAGPLPRALSKLQRAVGGYGGGGGGGWAGKLSMLEKQQQHAQAFNQMGTNQPRRQKPGRVRR
jgi:hypothetical protein